METGFEWQQPEACQQIFCSWQSERLRVPPAACKLQDPDVLLQARGWSTQLLTNRHPSHGSAGRKGSATIFPCCPCHTAQAICAMPTHFNIALTVSMYKDLQVISPLLAVVLVQTVSVYKAEEPPWWWSSRTQSFLSAGWQTNTPRSLWPQTNIGNLLHK